MTTEETVEKMVLAFVNVCNRVERIGADQYSYDRDTRQKFEDKSQQELLKETLEEVEDAIAYLAFLHIKITEMKRWAK